MKSRLPKLTRNISYFVMSDEVMRLYRKREISAVDVKVYAYLCSLRREYDGICVCQRQIAFMCGLSAKTVSTSAERLYSCGLIKNIIIETVKQKRKYKTAIYQLKPLPKSGFCFVTRNIFSHYSLKPKMFATYLFMCNAQSHEYGKSWNSYSDICEQLGFGKCQLSEVKRLVKSLVELGLIKKTVRKIKHVFVDNIYRVCGIMAITAKENHPAANRVKFKKQNENAFSIKIIIPLFFQKVKRFRKFFYFRGVGCDFTDNYINQKGVRNIRTSLDFRQKKRIE